MKHCPNPECPYLADTGQAGEYRDEIVSCSDCGTDLTQGEPPPMEERGQIRWTGVMVVPDPHAAHLARTALRMEGIPSEMRRVAKDGDALSPGTAAAAEIIVPDHMAESAREVLEARTAAPVPLPDDEELEFIGADGEQIEFEPTDDDPLAAGELDTTASSTADATSFTTGSSADAAVATDTEWPPCPRCGNSAGVTHVPPDSGAESRGLLKRLFSPKHRWNCLACDHRW